MLQCIAILLISVVLLMYIGSKITMGICRASVCLVGKTALVTGGNEGIGYQVAHQLASRGCRVFIADVANAENSKNRIIAETGNAQVHYKFIDLTSFQSVRDFAADFRKTVPSLDFLIHNAGVSYLPGKTADNINGTHQVNFYSPFLLTHLLLDLLKKPDSSRVIATSSAAAFISNLSEKNINPEVVTDSFWVGSFFYGSSKLCQIIAFRELAQRLKNTKITVNTLHPGCVRTKTVRKGIESAHVPNSANYVLKFWLFTWDFLCFVAGKDAWEGSQTTMHLALSKDVEHVTGKHFWDCYSLPVLPLQAYDKRLCQLIWKSAEEMTKLEEKLRLPS